MKVVGKRKEPALGTNASGASLAETARLSESLSGFRRTGFIPKGLYRYPTHEEANRHWLECLAKAMARKGEAS